MIDNQNKTRTGWKALAGAAVLSAVGSLGAAAQNVSSSLENTAAQGPAASAPEDEGAQGGPIVAGQRRFDIAPGELTSALEAYGHVTGVHVHSKVPTDKLSGFQTKGVKGVYSPADALNALLSGTGLDSHFEAPDRVEINIRSTEQVDVNASVASTSLQQFTEPLVDTAQTVGVVPQFILSDQADTSLRDSLRNIPGISIAAGEGGAQGDNLTIRGFTARNDIFLDGIRDFGSYYRDSFDYDAIEVLEGPAGVEFGRGSTGGVVNQETKQAHLGEGISGTLQLGTNLMRRVTADINEPIKNLDGAAFRLNVVGDESNVSERNVTNVRRFGIAPAIAFGLNGHTRAYISYLHEGENDTPDYGLPYFGNYVLPGINRANYYGFAEGDYFRTNPDIVTGRAEHDFGLHLTLRNSLRFANYPRDVNITEPQVNTTPIYSTAGGVVYATCSPTATTPCYNLNTPAGSVQVRRAQIQVTSVEDMLWDQASAVGHNTFGRIGNDYTVIVEGGRERSRPQRLAYATNLYTNAVNPTPNDIMPAALTQGAKSYVNSQSYGIGFNDTFKPFAQLQLSGGVRFDYFNTDYTTPGTTPAVHLSRLDKKPNYRAAAVYKPRPNGSVYFDWGTSFNPSAESLSLSATNAVQAPQTNETYEAGVKWTFFRDRLNLNGSWFQTVKDNVYEADPNNSANVIPVGDQRVRGVQVGGLGHLPQHFDIIFGYAYLSGLTIGSIANYSPFSAYYKSGDPVFGAFPYYIRATGNPFANVPRNSANLFVTHSLRWRFVGGFGFNQISARRASSTGPVVLPFTNAATPVAQLPLAFKVIPGYWTFNAMIRRPISDHVDFQANVQNLTNAFFIDQPHPNHLIPGEGINAQFGFLYKF